ncbi:hypothetical protein RFI_19899 [Reticulomyxa filosa]|uniref:Fe2OG dioxygenase domain-containing protein n=1 Tax=Reticulomyxa filosa TaxID=46433 RepID=X6MTY6_RETFI|nr:hypothetical protein RFI_19899 [Reticulomyxa filosa]|eukprot:ETO17423.1 hypothetical protein RFI_19899 [Reticulomyxa filosa]
MVTQLENGQWGFDVGQRQRVTEDLVRRRHSTTVMTHVRNLIFPIIIPHHDPLGFKKIKMPKGLHRRLMVCVFFCFLFLFYNFYRNYYDQRVAENWEDEGTQLNYFDVKSHIISLDNQWEERDAIANDVVKPILAEWSGGEELEFTAFYGIREYARNALLRNHVDRSETHVFSAILQISQTDVQSPWELEVIGFDGKRYLVELEPGEMVLYEGHTLIHGRPHPLNGTLYSNAFCHFKPKSWSWSTGSVWKHPDGKAALSKLRVTLNDIYR